MLERASPAQLRESLEMAHMFVKMGINFVAMPVANRAEEAQLARQVCEKLAAMKQEAEGSEPNG